MAGWNRSAVNTLAQDFITFKWCIDKTYGAAAIGKEDLVGTAFRIKTTLVDVDTLLKGSIALDEIREKDRKKGIKIWKHVYMIHIDAPINPFELKKSICWWSLLF